MSLAPADVCVIGAGLTGVCAALELARAGVAVTLVDQDAQPLNRASLRNEGKIHLGLVFANDPSLATASLMLDGALSFRRHLARWIGARAAALSASTPFTYLVAGDSILSPDTLAERYAAIEALYHAKLRSQPSSDYLGTRPDRLATRVPVARVAPALRPDGLAGAFRTSELALDTAELAAALRVAIAGSPRIRFLPRHAVASVARRADGFAIDGAGPAGPWRLVAGQVVNASWESRLAIDRTVGLDAAPGWLHRLKYRVVAQLPADLCGGPSVTMVQGPYGDVVVRADGTAYFSWYPLGLKGWTHDLAPPASWAAPCRGDADPDTAAAFAEGCLRAIDRWYPGAARSTPLAVDAGVIVAYGRSDVDDPKSGLHDRTRVGVHAVDGYCSVDPGKLTTAPLFGIAAAREVLGARVAE